MAESQNIRSKQPDNCSMIAHLGVTKNSDASITNICDTTYFFPPYLCRKFNVDENQSG